MPMMTGPTKPLAIDSVEGVPAILDNDGDQ